MTLPVFQSTPIDGSPALLTLRRPAGAADTVKAGVAAAFALRATSWTVSATTAAPRTASEVRERRARRRAGMADLFGLGVVRNYPDNGQTRSSSRISPEICPNIPIATAGWNRST